MNITPMISWAIPVIVVRVFLIFISTYLRRSKIPANKSRRPIVNSDNMGRLLKFWRFWLSKILGSRIPMIKNPIIMIPTNMRKPPKATANLLNGLETHTNISCPHHSLYLILFSFALLYVAF